MSEPMLAALESFIKTLPVIPFSLAYASLRIVLPQAFGRQPQTKDIEHFIAFSAVLVLAWLWLVIADIFVPEPYLDEVFHVPQAQKYCEGKWSEWDDKITTPPGLYGLTMLIRPLLPFMGIRNTCGAFALRSFNALTVTAIGFFAMLSRSIVEARMNDLRSTTLMTKVSTYAMHTGINIALFPVLFFFSGLYYTDVASTLIVLVAYHNHLLRTGPQGKSLLSDIWTVALGLLALAMRQTNVFWVCVYVGGLEAVHVVKTLRPELVDQPYSTTLTEQLHFITARWAVGEVHDPPVGLAWPDDILFCVASLAVAGISNPVRVIRQIWPYITVLASFGAFVVWNGGVVLGDKSNHVATIHLAQMLYIWPFIAFFSAPLFLPWAIPWIRAARDICVDIIFHSHARLESGSGGQNTSTPRPGNFTGSSKKRSPSGNNRAKPVVRAGLNSKPDEKSPTLKWAIGIFHGKLYWPLYIAATVIASFLIVRYNTIIHPFTLADNRHYMFYIFRYTIRRPGSFRYLLILPYTVCRWLSWDALLGCTGSWFFSTPDCSTFYDGNRDAPFICYPFWVAYGTRRRQTKEPKTPVGGPVHLPPPADAERTGLDDPVSTAAEPVPTSVVALLLLTTALSLVTAPLVEPRYFILPWVFWRLLVPAWRPHEHTGMAPNPRDLDRVPGLGAVFRFGKKFDVRLVLETAWFLAINAATMYIFLAKPYVWRAEDGTELDGGRLQRFMW